MAYPGMFLDHFLGPALTCDADVGFPPGVEGLWSVTTVTIREGVAIKYGSWAPGHVRSSRLLVGDGGR